MAKPGTDVYLELLYQACASAFGIVVWTDDALKLRQRLYVARRESGDPLFDSLSFVTSPTNPENLWIVKRHAT